jgi:hypothetical protein
MNILSHRSLILLSRLALSRRRSWFEIEPETSGNFLKALVAGPNPGFGGEFGGSKKLCVDVLDARPVQWFEVDELHHLVIVGDNPLGEIAYQSDDLASIVKVAKRKLTGDPPMSYDSILVE